MEKNECAGRYKVKDVRYDWAWMNRSALHIYIADHFYNIIQCFERKKKLKELYVRCTLESPDTGYWEDKCTQDQIFKF